MDSNQDKVIEKVRKLLAIADSARNDCENERETAMRQAHALLAKHGLEMAQVGDIDAQTDYLGALVKGTFAMRTKNVWEAGIYHQIAELNGCKCVREPARRGQPAKVYIFGRKVRAEIIKQMSLYIVESVLREATNSGFRSASFGIGAWQGVAKQVQEILANMRAGKIDGEQLPQSTALVVVDQHKQALIEATRIRDEACPRLTSGGSSRGSRDHVAFAAGFAHGSKIGLNAQVGQSRAKALR